MDVKRRVFIAVPIPSQVKELCNAQQDALKVYAVKHGIDTDSVKFIPESELHCTVFPPVYLSDEQVEIFCKAVDQFDSDPLELSTGSIGYFEDKGIVWLGLQGKGFHTLVLRLYEHLNLFDFIQAPIEREFVGHITLARRYKVKDPAYFLTVMNSALQSDSFIADKLVCLESMQRGGKLIEYKRLN